MNVLITGIFGNLGQETLRAIFDHDVNFELRVIARDHPKNRKLARKWGERLQVYWGDVRDHKVLRDAMQDVHTVVHLAAIIPPHVYDDEAAAASINVEGTRAVVQAAEASGVKHLVYASSVVVYGASRPDLPPRRPSETPDPIEAYGRQKLAAEEIVQASAIPSTILRIGAAPPVAITDVDPYVFEIGLDSRIEFVHPQDVGIAVANSIGNEPAYGKILNLGGGVHCRFTYREFFDISFTRMGLGPMPEAAFASKMYCTDWMDTEESQRLLRFQQRNYEEWINELVGLLGWRRIFIRALRPMIRWWILRSSPYYRKAIR